MPGSARGSRSCSRTGGSPGCPGRRRARRCRAAAARLLVLGLVNAHSHAFQRALRGRVERIDPEHPHDDFWSWREEMYAAAGALDPAGVRRASEALFARHARRVHDGRRPHYVHHRPDGTPYDYPNALAHAVVDAARAAASGLPADDRLRPRGPRPAADAGPRRSCDASPEAYLARVDALRAELAGDPLITVAYAPHSVRRVPRDWLDPRSPATRPRPASRCTSTRTSSRARSSSRSTSTGLRRMRPAFGHRRRSSTRRTPTMGTAT